MFERKDLIARLLVLLLVIPVFSVPLAIMIPSAVPNNSLVGQAPIIKGDKAPYTPDSNISWVEEPKDQIADVDYPFEYALSAQSPVGIDSWWLNDTVHFQINETGYISNNSLLVVGDYGLQVWVNDTSGDELTANFTIHIRKFVDWTVLVYLDGDNDLEEFAFDDLNSMELIGSTNEVKIIVLVDFGNGYEAPFTGAKTYEVLQDANLNSIGSLELVTALPSEPNMGAASTLRDFLIFGQSYAPAEHYLVVLWDHGAGAFGLCTDDTSGNHLTIAEFNQALSDPQVQHLDIVALDACLMGQLEVTYEIRESTDMVVFSEESVPLTGFPYEDILLNLTTFPSSTPKSVASSIVYYYVSAYDVSGRYYDPLNNDICLSAVETAKIQSLAQSLDQLTQLLLDDVTEPHMYEAISWAREGTQAFAWADFIDLYSFADNLASQFVGSSSLYNRATNLSVAVKDVIYEEMHLAGLPEAHGLGVVFGSYESHQLALATDTNWDECMEAFIDVGFNFDNALLLVDSIGPLGTPNLHCGYLDGEDDSVYFVFTAMETGLYTFQLDAAWIQYTTDFDLYIYDIYQNILDRSISGDSSETISLHLTAGNTYYVEIYSYASGYDGIGVFFLNVDTPSGIGPFPPILGQLLIIGFVILMVAGILGATYYFQRRPSAIPTPPPPRYTGATYPSRPKTDANDTAKFCAYCGALVPSGARYCPVCGASII